MDITKNRELDNIKNLLTFETTKLRSKTIKEKKVCLCNLSVSMAFKE
jgi:hypothetical protein